MSARLLAAWREPLTRNAALMAMATVAAGAFGLLFWAVAARTYSREAVGTAAALVALGPLVGAIASLGLPETVLRHLVSAPRPRALVAGTAAIVVASASVLGVLWWAAARGTALGDGPASLAVLVVIGAATAASMILDASVIAARRPALLVIENVAAGATRVAVLVALSGNGAGGVVVAAAAGLAVGVAVAGANAWWALGRLERVEVQHYRLFGFSVVNWVAILASMAPVAALPAVVLAERGARTAAYVGVTFGAAALFTLVPRTLARSLFAEGSATPGRIGPLARHAAKVALVANGTIAAVMMVAAPLVLRIYGSAYSANATGLLRLLALAGVVAIPNYIGDVVLNVRRNLVGFLVANVTGAALVAIGLYVGSRAGPTGIGVGMVLSQAAYGLVVWAMVLVSGPRTAGANSSASPTNRRTAPVGLPDPVGGQLPDLDA